MTPVKKYTSPLERERARQQAQERYQKKRKLERDTARLLALPNITEKTRSLVETFWALWEDFHKTENLLENELYRSGIRKKGLTLEELGKTLEKKMGLTPSPGELREPIDLETEDPPTYTGEEILSLLDREDDKED